MGSDIVTRVGDRTLTLTNLDKVLYPSVGFTKAEVIDYYLRIASVMLPHIRDRVMTRLRFPDGVGANRFSFYEKNAPMATPDWVRRVDVSTSDGIIDYVVADDEAAVVWLANLAALEMHVPQWTVRSATSVDGIVSLPEHEPRSGEPLADRVVVDLDPGAGMTIVDSSRAALIVAARLAEDGLIPIAQTSGSKGIQVYAAIAPTRSKTAWGYVKQLNASLHKAQPDFFIATMSVEQRAGRIYVDYNQNLAARNTIAPYSMRGRERPAVATPVTWEELGGVRGPDDLRFSPEQVLARVAEQGDLAADLLTSDAPALPETA
ncbi:MAG TPA: non-homologous end-joining DNA ligase [Propionibacteriaceae bacterium]|jgi:bifunctional non-homologous end joining protein LigD|nr:non-homologous end-joining DNA ligase [Propionibacteriaceae bacterium]